VAAVRALLVEDDFLVRLALADALREEGFEVIDVADGDEAVAWIDGPDGFNLLLTDIQIPGKMDGIGVALHARNRDPGIPVVVVTGRPEGVSGLEDLQPPAVLIRKPYAPEEVLAAARRLVGNP
jgi:DNA-binding response OmpR family regulator